VYALVKRETQRGTSGKTRAPLRSHSAAKAEKKQDEFYKPNSDQKGGS